MLLFVAAALAGAPTIPEGAVLSPTFALSDGLQWSAGTAFVAQTQAGPTVVTALHLFGPAAGLRYQLSFQEVRQKAAMQGVDRLTGRKAVASRDALLTPNADATSEDPATDIVAFRLVLDKKGRAGGKMPVAALPVVDKCPPVGAPVYVPGTVMDRAQGIPWFEGVVEACDARTITFRYAAAALQTAGTSGAPVLDATGRVRGMVWGGGTDGGSAVGVAMSGEALLAHLEGRSLAPKAPPPPPPSPWGTLQTGWDPVPNRWGYDLPGLHARLLPDWGISGRHDDTLKAGLSDPELGPIFQEIARLSWADNMGNFARITELMRRWDAVYRKEGVPLRMNAGARGQTLAWMTWNVVSAATVRLGSQTVTADIVGRLDRLNVADAVPTILDGDAGVVVPLEDLRDDQLYGVWKRLDPAARDPLARMLTEELRGVVGEEGLGVLARTAPLRREIEAVRDAISRRGSCSNYGISRLPWWGVDAHLDTALAAVAVPSGKCAPVTTSELERLRKATTALAAETALEPALRKLAAHMARSVAIEGAAMRLACLDCGWESRVGPGLVAALSDAPTRAVATARLCERGKVDKTLDTALDALGACAGKDVRATIAGRWPAAWGEPTVTVEGVPAEVPVKWPRDRVE